MGSGEGYLRYKEIESDDQTPERNIWKDEKSSYSTLPINTIIDYLSVQIYYSIKHQAKDIFELSQCSKEEQLCLDNGVYNWEQRIFKDFNVVPVSDDFRPLGYRDYLNQYEIWKANQLLHLEEVNQKDDIFRMLVLFNCFVE